MPEASTRVVNLAEIRTRPRILYEGEIGDLSCFRLANAGDKLDGLLFKGEVIEAMCKAGVEHRIGNVIRGVELPDNPGRKDFFLLIAPADVGRLEAAFPIGRMPGEDARTRPVKARPVLRLVV